VGDHGAAVVADQVVGVQQHRQLAADEADRDRVGVAADGDLAEAVDPRSEPASGLEHLAGQWPQQRLFLGAVLADGAGLRHVEHAVALAATAADSQPQADVRVLCDPAGRPFGLFAHTNPSA
jgi:hypothetical protein